MVDIANEYRNDPLMRRVSLGIDVQHFIERDKVGMYLIERAHENRIEALEQLAVVDASDTHLIKKLQNNALIPELILRWLEEAISEANAAESQIQAEDTAELQGY